MAIEVIEIPYSTEKRISPTTDKDRLTAIEKLILKFGEYDHRIHDLNHEVQQQQTRIYELEHRLNTMNIRSEIVDIMALYIEVLAEIAEVKDND